MRYSVLQELFADRRRANAWRGHGHFRWKESEAIAEHNRRVGEAARKAEISDAEAWRLTIPRGRGYPPGGPAHFPPATPIPLPSGL